MRYEKQYELGTKSIKYYEYRGLHKIFNKLTFTGNKWLDYGCGVGGLLRYGNEQGIDIAGFDEGYAADFARRNGHYVIDRETLSELENDSLSGTTQIIPKHIFLFMSHAQFRIYLVKPALRLIKLLLMTDMEIL